jgi:hypothetical protein
VLNIRVFSALLILQLVFTLVAILEIGRDDIGLPHLGSFSHYK